MSAAWVESLRDVPEIGASPVALLGAVISGPPLAPYGLIRQARRTIFGGGTLYLEAMLCDSDLVDAVSKDGVELAHEFRAAAQLALRERVMAGQIPVTDLRAANRCDHFEMSPLLSLEEQLVWAYVSQPDPAPACDRLLSDCLLSIVREDRHHILDWAAGALRRLPDLVVNTQAAWLLSELCNTLHRETRKLAPPPTEQIEDGLLQEVLPLLPSALVGFYRDGTTLSIGPINRLRRTAFVVPGIALRPVTVTWTDTEPVDEPSGPDANSGPNQDEHSQHRRHELTVDVTGRVDLIPVGNSAVQLRNAAGAIVSLRSFQSGTTAPELIELDKSLDLLEDTWRNARSVTAVILRAVSPTTAIVRFIDAWAISGHLRFERSYLEETGISPWKLVGSEIDVRISSFERSYQRVLCRPAPPPPWSAGILVPGMEVEARFAGAVNFGFFVNVPTTEQGFEGPTIDGLVHNSQVPGFWPNSVSALQKGDTLQLKILNIDEERKRLSLGVVDDIAQRLAQFPEGTVFTGRVGKLMPYGVFIELFPGFTALLHNSEIAAERELVAGEELRVRVINVDEERSRVSLATEPRLPADSPFRQLTLKPRGDGAGPKAASISATRESPQPDAVAEFVRQKLRQIRKPMMLTSLASEVKIRFGEPLANDWLGYEAFKRMLLALVPEATVDKVPPGHVHPLSDHSSR